MTTNELAQLDVLLATSIEAVALACEPENTPPPFTVFADIVLAEQNDYVQALALEQLRQVLEGAANTHHLRATNTDTPPVADEDARVLLSAALYGDRESLHTMLCGTLDPVQATFAAVSALASAP